MRLRFRLPKLSLAFVLQTLACGVVAWSLWNGGINALPAPASDPAGSGSPAASDATAVPAAAAVPGADAAASEAELLAK